MMFIQRALLVLIAALACPALAVAQQPAVPQQTVVEQAPPAPPVPEVPLGQALDTVRMLKQLSELRDGEGPVHEWVFTMSYSQAGEPVSVAVLFNGDHVREAHRAVARVLLAGARRLPAAHTPRTLSITAVPGSKAVLRTPLETQPAALDKRRIERDLSRSARGLRADRALRGTHTVVSVRMRVGSDGTVSNPLIPVPSPHPQVDEVVIRCAETWRFRPAAIEGRPVAVFIELPITMAIR